MIHIIDEVEPRILISDLELDTISHCYHVNTELCISNVSGEIISAFKVSDDFIDAIRNEGYLNVQTIKANSEALSGVKRAIYFD